jgi:hypothetical protein
MFTIVPTDNKSCVCDVDNEKIRIHWPDHTRWWDTYFKVSFNHQTYHCDALKCTISEKGQESDMMLFQLTEQIVSNKVSDMHIDRVHRYIDSDICVTLIVKRAGLPDLKVKIPCKCIWNFRFE